MNKKLKWKILKKKKLNCNLYYMSDTFEKHQEWYFWTVSINIRLAVNIKIIKILTLSAFNKIVTTLSCLNQFLTNDFLSILEKRIIT